MRTHSRRGGATATPVAPRAYLISAGRPQLQTQLEFGSSAADSAKAQADSVDSAEEAFS